MTQPTQKYKAGFTTGSLLLREANALIKSIKNFEDFLAGKEELDQSVIPLKSENSQKRIRIELEKRLQKLPDPVFLNTFQASDERNKKLILFYATTKLYGLISDFMLEEVFSKWNNQDLEITTETFVSYLFLKADTHPELDKYKESTHKKMADVVLRMLRELELVKNNQLQKVQFDQEVLNLVHQFGDSWFLDAVLLNSKEKKAVASL